MTDIKGTITKITSTVMKTSGELLKSTKLSINLASEEENLKALYIDIGKKVHEIYAYGGTLGKFFDEKYQEIVAMEEKINILKEQIGSAKGTKICPACSKTMDKAAEFCPKCGKKFYESERTLANSGLNEEIKPEINTEIKSEIKPEIKSEVKICKVCGTENESAAKFCIACARMF